MNQNPKDKNFEFSIIVLYLVPPWRDLNFDILFISVASVTKNFQNKKAVRKIPTATNKKAVGSVLSAHGPDQLNIFNDQLPGGGQTPAK